MLISEIETHSNNKPILKISIANHSTTHSGVEESTHTSYVTKKNINKHTIGGGKVKGKYR